MKYKNILITGGAGFVGSNLSMKLKEKYNDINIFVLDNLKRRGSELNLQRFKENNISFIHGDIRNKEDLEDLKNIDLIIECSAEPSVMAGINSSPEYLINTNLLGTINCLELARKNNSDFLFISTSRIYPIDNLNSINFDETETRFELNNKQNIVGTSAKGISEDFPLKGARSLYGSTKLCSEYIIEEYIYNYGLKAIINRCGVLTGPWQMGKTDQGFVTLWVARHIFKKPLSYIGFNGSGKQVRDILHIEDLFNLIDIQINDFDKFNKEVFNIGGGNENSISLKELTIICEKITNSKIEISPIKETRQGDLKSYITDYTKINNLCGWKPKKNIEETIYDIYKWINENKSDLENILN